MQQQQVISWINIKTAKLILPTRITPREGLLMLIDETFCPEKCFACYFWKWANLNRQTDTEKCKLE